MSYGEPLETTHLDSTGQVAELSSLKAVRFVNRRLAALKSAKTRRQQELEQAAQRALAALDIGDLATAEQLLRKILPGCDAAQ